MRRRRLLHSGAAALLAVCLVHPAVAQRRTSFGVVADNDRYNFWQSRERHGDDEYTQGLQLWLALPIAPRNLPGWVPGRLLCRAVPDRCPWLTLSLQQAIYTPRIDVAEPQPDRRPYAGWLAGHVAIARHSPSDFEELELELGVTGPPSLAEAAQKAVHRLFGYQEPLGWERQLPAEPGATLSYRRARQLFATSAAAPLGLRVGLAGEGRLGTVNTSGSAALHLALGLRPPAPRLLDLSRSRNGFALWLSAAAQLDGVLRNEFVQGTFFRDSEGLPLRHLVPQGSVGIHARIGRVALGWTAVRRGREYPTQPSAHTYSSLTLFVMP